LIWHNVNGLFEPFPPSEVGGNAATGGRINGSTTDIAVAVSAVWAYLHPTANNYSLPKMW
jgi:hypothetical protein